MLHQVKRTHILHSWNWTKTSSILFKKTSRFVLLITHLTAQYTVTKPSLMTSLFYRWPCPRVSWFQQIWRMRSIRIMPQRSSLMHNVDCNDVAHFCWQHESNHQPKMCDGTVIKSNGNQRYATTMLTGFFIRELARRNSLPIQATTDWVAWCNHWVLPLLRNSWCAMIVLVDQPLVRSSLH